MTQPILSGESSMNFSKWNAKCKDPIKTKHTVRCQLQKSQAAMIFFPNAPISWGFVGRIELIPGLPQSRVIWGKSDHTPHRPRCRSAKPHGHH